VTDPYQLGRIVVRLTATWLDDEISRNTQELYVGHFSRTLIMRAMHIGFIRTEQDGRETTGTVQAGIDTLRFLPSSIMPTGPNELPKLLVNLTADKDYVKGNGGYYKVEVKLEYDF
jgi:hypothetical protein